MRQIDADALKAYFAQIAYIRFTADMGQGDWEMFSEKEIEDIIDKAPTVESVTVFTESTDKKATEDLKTELKNVLEDTYATELTSTGYNSHDCESFYVCPFCKYEYSSWGLFHKGINSGEKFKCFKCGKALLYR